MTGEQCKAARHLLGWAATDLARAAEVHRNTVLRFERGEPILKHNQTPIRAALEAQGVEFLEVTSVVLSDGKAVDVEGVAMILPDGSMVRVRTPASE